MKTVKNIFFLAVVLFLASCGTTTKFPVSNITPAAEITAKKKQDKNKNFEVTIKANNLASPERLDPSKTAYIVWVKTDDGQTRNIGQLRIKNAKSAELNTIVPSDFNEIFVTAEDDGAVSYPSGIEITRTTIDD